MRLSYCTVVIPYLTNSTLIIFLWDVIGKTEWRDNSNRLLPGSFFKNRYLDLQKWLLNLNSSSSNTQLQFILELRRTELLIVHVKVTRSAFKNKRRAPKGQVGSRICWPASMTPPSNQYVFRTQIQRFQPRKGEEVFHETKRGSSRNILDGRGGYFLLESTPDDATAFVL